MECTGVRQVHHCKCTFAINSTTVRVQVQEVLRLVCEQGGGFRLLYRGYHLEVPPISLGGQSNSFHPEGVCGFNFITTRSNWEHLVLSALSSPPFEPLAQVEVKWLSIKTAFLLAITSAKRVEELDTVSISDSCMRWGPGGSGVTLWPNVAFLPKVLPRRHHNQPIYLARFEPTPAENAARVLCPVRVLAAYIDAPAAIRQTDQLFVCYGVPEQGLRPF